MTAPASADLGPIVTEHRQGSAHLVVHAEGFAVEDGGRSAAGPFDAIARVEYQQTDVKINGVPLPRMTLLGLHLLEGGSFTFRAYGKDAAAPLQALIARSEPAIARRVAATIDAGKEADFGAVRLSRTRLLYQGRFGKWKELPLERLSGFLLRTGWFLLDADPDAPHVVFEARTGRIGNVCALVETLRRLKPDADLDDPAVAERSIARASALPWKQTTAAKRWIGSPSRPVRFAIALGLVLPLALWLALPVLPSVLRTRERAAHHAHVEALARVGDAAIADMAKGTGPTTPVGVACKGKVPLDDVLATGVYVGPLPEKAAEKLKYEDMGREEVGRTLVGGGKGGALAAVDARGHDDYNTVGGTWSLLLADPPWEWGRHLGPLSPAVDAMKLLVVTRVEDIELIEKTGSSTRHRPQRATLRTRVVPATGGAAFCEGVDTVWLAESDSDPRSLQRAPLALLCPSPTAGAVCAAAFSPSAPFATDSPATEAPQSPATAPAASSVQPRAPPRRRP
jgi:hypothetical protein